MKLFLQKTDPSETALFNHCFTEAVKDPSNSLWYTTTPVKPKQFSSFMPDICKNAGISRYTGHSLRATSIQALSDAGFEARSIMFMSDHKREDSLQTYSRRPSTNQKLSKSNVLGSLANGQNPSPNCEAANVAESNSLVPKKLPSDPEMAMTVSSTQQYSQSHRLSGFAPGSSFANCTFNITFQQ